MTDPVRIKAPAKVNLCLFLGRAEPGEMHALMSIFEPVELCDEVTVTRRSGGEDRVGYRFIGEHATEDPALGEDGRDTVSVAIAYARELGFAGPALDVTVGKRIPSGAGLGGGSCDAAAILRYLRDSEDQRLVHDEGSAELDEASEKQELVREISLLVGADVRSQLELRPCLAGGRGDRIISALDLPDHYVLLVTGGGRLSTAAVYAEADRLELGRSSRELERIEAELAALSFPLAQPGIMVNDLEEAAFSLRPELRDVRDRLAATGASIARMTGSGSTVFGVFGSRAEAEAARAGLEDPLRERSTVVAAPYRPESCPTDDPGQTV